MADCGFNGSTLSFGSEVTTKIRSISYSSSGAKVQTSASNATQKTYVAGIADDSVTFVLSGTTAIEVGDIGAVSVKFNDGTTPQIAFTNGICVEASTDGSEDSDITSSVTLVPYATT